MSDAAGDDRSPFPPVSAAEAAENAAAARTGRLLLIFVAIGFSVGIAVLVFAIRLDWT